LRTSVKIGVYKRKQMGMDFGTTSDHTRKHIRMPLVMWHRRNSENECKCETSMREDKELGSITRVSLSVSVISDVAHIIRVM